MSPRVAKEKQESPSKLEKFEGVIQSGSLVSVNFGGRALKDKYFMWLLFTLVIGILCAMKLYEEINTIG